MLLKILIPALTLTVLGCAGHQTLTNQETVRGPSSVAPRHVGYNGQCPNLIGTWRCEGGYQIVFRGSADPTYLNYSGDDWKVSGKKEIVQKDGQPLPQQITCADGVLYRKYWVGSISPNPEEYAIKHDDNELTALGTKCLRSQ
jgi:hypothetical protein